jgi:hypothetical protein
MTLQRRRDSAAAGVLAASAAGVNCAARCRSTAFSLACPAIRSQARTARQRWESRDVPRIISNGRTGNSEDQVARIQHRWIPPAERDDQPARRVSLRRAALRLVRPGDENRQLADLERADPIERLAEAKRRTWEIFARWLMIGGLACALGLIVLLAFIYSGHPYQP